ncbi:kinesin-like protein KIF15, partial [Biomphalaria glabrata]
GLIEQVICNPRDAYQLIIKGWLNRGVAPTSMNREGSRSHAVFTVKIESKEEVLSPLDDKVVIIEPRWTN